MFDTTYLCKFCWTIHLYLKKKKRKKKRIIYWNLICNSPGYVASGNSRLHRASNWSCDKQWTRPLIPSSSVCNSWKQRPPWVYHLTNQRHDKVWTFQTQHNQVSCKFSSSISFHYYSIVQLDKWHENFQRFSWFQVFFFFFQSKIYIIFLSFQPNLSYLIMVSCYFSAFIWAWAFSVFF